MLSSVSGIVESDWEERDAESGLEPTFGVVEPIDQRGMSLLKMIPFGEASLRLVLSGCVDHYPKGRNHLGKVNAIPIQAPVDRMGQTTATI